MSYQTLFSLDIFHNYYQSHLCSDFSLEPTFDCANLIKGHRLILKNKVNGIEVIARFDAEQKPWIKLAEDLKFTFILKLKNNNFVNFTDIAPLENSTSVHLFDNQNITRNESLELEQKLEKVSNVALSQRDNYWGIVEIYNKASFPENGNYKITFEAKKQRWKYYLIANEDTPADKFEIKDQEQKRSPKISFVQREIEEQDRVGLMIAKQFPTSQKYLFQSETEIDVKEVPLKNIQLLKKATTEGSSTVYIEHLPNPPNSSATKIINLLNKV